jgi:hypothetical protein
MEHRGIAESQVPTRVDAAEGGRRDALMILKKKRKSFRDSGGFRWTPGECYQDALNYVMEVEPSATLVHGTAEMVAPDGGTIRGGHAWVEMGRGSHRYCIDGYTQVTGGPMRRADYYRHRGARAIARYTLKEACLCSVAERHWGPWAD